MRFLSTKRHSRAAKPVLLLLALVLVGCVYAFVSPSASGSADTNASTQVARGKEIFQQNCSSCHGLNGEGTTQGPSLAGVGAAAVDFQMATGRMPMARPEAQAPSKKTKFTDEETASVGAYVASLAPGPKVPSSQSLNTSNLKAEELARGAELFKTNCSACHNIEGRGGALPEGAYAPSLMKTSNKHIYEAMRTGPQQMPVFSKSVITDQDAREIIGYLQTTHSEPNNGGFALGGIGPVTEGLFGWIIGIGGLVLIAGWLARKGARAK